MLLKIGQRFSKNSFVSTAQKAFSTNSAFGHVPLAPPDAIFGLTEAFRADTSEMKVNLGVGAYKTNAGKPFILPSVREAEKRLFERNSDHEYGPIDGLKGFREKSVELAFGFNSDIIRDGRYAAMQTLSGTGAIRSGLDFLKEWYLKKDAAVWVPNPTWPTHNAIANRAGWNVKNYRYYDRKTRSLDLEGMLEDLDNAESGQIVILHACAHNPTGQDPDEVQWS
jgi:aspartate aminotransferase